MKKKSAWVPALLLALSAFPVWAAPRVLVLSGGGNPVHNNYSQYLQTKTLSEHLRKRFGKKRVDVLFGAGNSDLKKGKVLPDVNAKFTDGKTGVQRVETVYGAIKGNRPGTKASVVSYFENELPKKLKPDDTFFLFVSDHGIPHPDLDDYSNNCIHLWSYDAATREDAPMEDQCLSKNELKKMISERVSPRRTVFAMSQCYSGGFHQMSVDESGKYPFADARVCGFTSVPEDLVASGCTDDVQADRYQGYERYFTEELTGRDVVTGKKLRSGRSKTVKQADARAVLRDATVDVPMSTADYYLQAWYYALWADGFKPRSGTMRTVALRREMDAVTAGKFGDDELIARAGELGAIVEERLRVFKERSAVFTGLHPEWEGLVENGGAGAWEAKSAELEKRLEELDDEYATLNDVYWTLRYAVVFKNWFAAVKAGRVPGLSEEERDDFEVSFLGDLENQFLGDPLTDLGIEQNAILELSALTEKDPGRAKRFSAYMEERDAKMFAWAKSSGNRRLAESARRLERLKVQMTAGDQPAEDLSRRIAHVRRGLEMRQQLAAAVVLGMMEDGAAIGELKALEECQETPF